MSFMKTGRLIIMNPLASYPTSLRPALPHTRAQPPAFRTPTFHSRTRNRVILTLRLTLAPTTTRGGASATREERGCETHARDCAESGTTYANAGCRGVLGSFAGGIDVDGAGYERGWRAEKGSRHGVL